MWNTLRPALSGLALSVLLTTAVAQSQPIQGGSEDPFVVLAAKPPQEPADGGVHIVVQDADGSAAKDAVVVWIRFDQDLTERERDARSHRAAVAFPSDIPRRYAMYCASGTRYRLDERGETAVPKDGSVLAFAGDRFAWQILREDGPANGTTLRLAPPHRFTIEVVSATGAPVAGVPVALQDSPEQDPARIATTATDGTLAVRLMPHTPKAAKIVLDIVSWSSLATPLPEPGGSFRFVLPETTRVRAEFTGDVAPGAELQWLLQGQGVERGVPGDRTGPRSAIWPFVAIDATVTAIARLDELELARTTTSVQAANGPLTLVRTIREPTFALQVLAADGKPAIDHQVEVAWRGGGEGSGGDTRSLRTTNLEGWLEIPMPRQRVGKSDVVLVVTLLHGFLGRERIARGTVAVQADGDRRVVLGPVRCALLPILLAGTVCTAKGDPVPSVEVRMWHPFAEWTYTDAAGGFVLRGDVPRGAIEVHLPDAWCLVDGGGSRTKIPAGTTDARLVVRPTRNR